MCQLATSASVGLNGLENILCNRVCNVGHPRNIAFTFCHAGVEDISASSLRLEYQQAPSAQHNGNFRPFIFPCGNDATSGSSFYGWSFWWLADSRLCIPLYYWSRSKMYSRFFILNQIYILQSAFETIVLNQHTNIITARGVRNRTKAS